MSSTPDRAPGIAPYAYEGPEDLRALIDAQLREVIDPEVGLDIVDVGLVYGVTVKDGRVDVNLTMTSAACPVADVIVEDVEFKLDASLPRELLIHVELVWEPPWTPERISESARRKMGW